MPNSLRSHGLQPARLFEIPWTAARQAPLSMGFSKARALEWVAASFSKGSSQPRDRTCITCIGRQSLPLSHQGSQPSGEPPGIGRGWRHQQNQAGRILLQKQGLCLCPFPGPSASAKRCLLFWSQTAPWAPQQAGLRLQVTTDPLTSLQGDYMSLVG